MVDGFGRQRSQRVGNATIVRTDDREAHNNKVDKERFLNASYAAAIATAGIKQSIAEQKNRRNQPYKHTPERKRAMTKRFGAGA